MLKLIQNKSYIFKSISSGYIKTLISVAATLGFLPLVIDTIGITGFGLIAFISLGVSLSVLFDFGISKAAVYFVSKGDFGPIKSVLTLLMLTIIFIAFSIFFFHIFNNDNIAIEYDDLTLGFDLIVLSILIFIVNILLGFFRGLLEGAKLLYLVNTGFAIFSIINIPGLYVVTTLTNEPVNWALWVFCSYLLILMLHMYQARGIIKVAIFLKGDFKRLWNYSRSIYITNIITSGFMPFVKVVVTYFSSSTAVLGLFELAVRIAMLSNSFISVLATPYFAIFTERKNEKGQFAIAMRVLKKALVLYGLGIILFYLFGKSILGLISIESIKAYYPCLFVISGMCLNGVTESIYRYNLAYLRFLNLYLPKAMTYILFVITFCTMYIVNSQFGYVEKISLSYFVAQLLGSIFLIYMSRSHEKKRNLF